MTGPEKRKPGRPALPPGDGKTARVQLRVAPCDKSAWLAAAALAGMSLQSWVELQCGAGIARRAPKYR